MRDHTQIEELMAVAALGGLDPDDQRALERERAAHGTCDECRAIETSFGEVAGRLAFSLDPEPVDAAVADRIIARSGRLAVIHGIETTRLPDPPLVAIPDAGRDRDRRRRWTVLGIAATLVVAAVLSVAVVPRIGPVHTHVVASQQIVSFSPAGGSTVEGRLTMAYTPGTPGAVVWGSGLPDPGTGKVYELWTITGTTPTSAGCMEPADGAVAMHVDADVSDADSMALTEESSSCPAVPAGTAVLTAPLIA
jgi:hypothetical protein